MFAGFIDWMFISEIDDTQCRMLMAVNVTNSGVSSSLQHWRVRLTTEEGNEIEVKKIEPLQHETVTFVTDVQTDIQGSDFIKYKAYPKGIARGDGCRGLVMCNIPKDLKPNWSVVVSFDAFGETWTTNPYHPAKRPQAESFTAVGGWSGLDIRHRPVLSS